MNSEANGWKIADFGPYSRRAPRQRGYKYLRYFCSYSIKVTICVTAKLCHFGRELGAFPRSGFEARPWFSSVPDRRSRHVAETGRPSCKREDHHPRAVAAGDEGAEGEQLPPGQRIGETQPSQRLGRHQFPFPPVGSSSQQSFLLPD